MKTIFRDKKNGYKVYYLYDSEAMKKLKEMILVTEKQGLKMLIGKNEVKSSTSELKLIELIHSFTLCEVYYREELVIKLNLKEALKLEKEVRVKDRGFLILAVLVFILGVLLFVVWISFKKEIKQPQTLKNSFQSDSINYIGEPQLENVDSLEINLEL